MKNKCIMVFVFMMLASSILAKSNSCFKENATSDERDKTFLFDHEQRWNIGKNSVNEEPINPYNRWETYYLTIQGDTTINQKAYKMIYHSKDTVFNQKSIVHFIREDSTGKIYLSNNGSEDVIKFDFNLTKGETMTLSSDLISPSNNIFIRVDSTGIVTLNNNKEYKAQYITMCWYHNNEARCEDMSISDIWIPEIGSLKYELITPTLFTTGGYIPPVLLCHYSNGELIYVNPEYNSCEIRTSVTNVKEQKTLIDLFPVNNGILQLNILGSLHGTISIYNSNGKCIVFEKEIEGDSQIITHVSGLHIYRFTGNNGQIQTGKVMIK